MLYKTDQENFWAGKFGLNYIERNNSELLIHSKISMWTQMLRSTNNLRMIKELGCNIGLNLIALKRIKPKLELSGYEINEMAAKKAKELGIAKIIQGSILNQINGKKADLTFTTGVLIHINPKYLTNVYDNLVNGSRRYVLIAEYYNPAPVSVIYRGHKNRLFKRDFAGDLIENYGLNLVDYGFFYKRDNLIPQDDITWFLLEK